MAAPALVLDQQTTARTLAYLTGIAKAGPKAAADALNHAANVWQREVVRHCPVDDGLLRTSVAVHEATPGDLTALVGTNVPYAVFIEFDPGGLMAGGAVKAWQPGDPVIMDWAAKRGDLQTQKGLHGAAKQAHEKRVASLREKAADASTGEFMPPFRGSWQMSAPRIIENLRRRLASLLQHGRIK